MLSFSLAGIGSDIGARFERRGILNPASVATTQPHHFLSVLSHSILAMVQPKYHLVIYVTVQAEVRVRIRVRIRVRVIIGARAWSERVSDGIFQLQTQNASATIRQVGFGLEIGVVCPNVNFRVLILQYCFVTRVLMSSSWRLGSDQWGVGVRAKVGARVPPHCPFMHYTHIWACDHT